MVFIKNSKTYSSHFFDAGNGADPIEEICALVSAIDVGIDKDLLREIHHDVVDIFTGRNQHFRRNSMYYHTLRHTMMVTLALVRLLHGLFCTGRQLDNETVLQGVLCAYFHDAGLLVKKEELVSAFSCIPVHEQRSALFLKEYIAEKSTTKGWPPSLAEDVDIIIAYTRLQSDPTSFPAHSPQKQMLGQAVGMADLLAQMGDRYYLKSLPLLFKEQERGGVNIYDNVLDLLKYTADFFRDVVLVRLASYDTVSDAMQAHFRQWEGIDRNLYMDAIEKNLRYLEKILEECDGVEECIYSRLRRKVPRLEERDFLYNPE